MKWRLISECEPLSGFENMARDEAILKHVEDGESPPTIRLYRWSPSCLSLGKHQNPEVELNITAIKRDQIHFVKRYTGGRMVYHAEELTYSVIAPIKVASWGLTLQKTYNEISTWLLSCLSQFGEDFSIEKGDLVVKSQKSQVAQACFASTAKSEVVLGRKKLIGSAQRRTRKAFLQHGSILVGREHEKVTQYLNLSDNESLDYLTNLKKNSISLAEIGIKISPIELQSKFSHYFENHSMGVHLGDYTPEEKGIMSKLSKKHRDEYENNI